MDHKVIDIKTGGPLFSEELRAKLETSISESNGGAPEMVSNVENIICAALVQAAKAFAENLAVKILGVFSQNSSSK